MLIELLSFFLVVFNYSSFLYSQLKESVVAAALAAVKPWSQIEDLWYQLGSLLFYYLAPHY
jgi:hypothetical protein